MQRKIFGREHLKVPDAVYPGASNRRRLHFANRLSKTSKIQYASVCSPACFRVSGTDISEVIQACRERLLVVAKKRVAVAIAVICGYGNSFNLARTTEVISSLHDAVLLNKMLFSYPYSPI